ncbi:hypothetical protein L207DRAFT_282075 [Hyaloscypha variabilis F]|uniref:Uncharacterized protein n=1 Tax=Hyaloscypha variabilis (strain UAMH 11265 / GT02V1 / F) TaxID=1149755 RepID=A0A2J6S111_HYAVF|nr:hypothetical protein L207DRAFT_282075 [Hyaloscypha variabilis F]
MMTNTGNHWAFLHSADAVLTPRIVKHVVTDIRYQGRSNEQLRKVTLRLRSVLRTRHADAFDNPLSLRFAPLATMLSDSPVPSAAKPQEPIRRQGEGEAQSQMSGGAGDGSEMTQIIGFCDDQQIRFALLNSERERASQEAEKCGFLGSWHLGSPSGERKFAYPRDCRTTVDPGHD